MAQREFAYAHKALFKIVNDAADEDGSLVVNEFDKLLLGKSDDEVKLLTNNPLDSHGRTLLHYLLSRHRHHPELAVKCFIEAGAEVNLRNEFDGMTPLCYAVSRGDPSSSSRRNVAATRVLIEMGKANVTLPEKHHGLTPLHLACLESEDGTSVALLRLLIDAGANPNARDAKGNTPMHYARKPELARLLLDDGASIDSVNLHGETPLYACLFRRIDGSMKVDIQNTKDIATFLIQSGAALDHGVEEMDVRGVKGILTPLDSIEMALQEPFATDGAPGATSSSLSAVIDFLTSVVPAIITRQNDKREQMDRLDEHGVQNVTLSAAIVGGRMLRRVFENFTGDNGEDIVERHVLPLLDMGADVNCCADHPKDTRWTRSDALDSLQLREEENDHGILVDEKGFAPLHYFFSPNKYLDYFLEQGREHGIESYVLETFDSLLRAATERHQKVNIHVKAANGTSLLHLAVQSGYPRVAARLAELCARDSESLSLMEARTFGEADPPHMTALHMASLYTGGGVKDNTKVVETLLHFGATLTAKTLDNESTPLHIACQHGRSLSNIQIMLKNIRKGKNDRNIINAVDSCGRSPLHYAVGRRISQTMPPIHDQATVLTRFFCVSSSKNSNEDETEIVLPHTDINVNIADDNRQTPLHVLAMGFSGGYPNTSAKGFLSIVQWLLNCNANPLAVDVYGMNPILWTAASCRKYHRTFPLIGCRLTALYEMLKHCDFSAPSTTWRSSKRPYSGASQRDYS